MKASPKRKRLFTIIGIFKIAATGIIAILPIFLLMAGCAPSVQIDTAAPEPTQSAPVNAEPTTPDTRADAYQTLKYELERNIALMESEPDPWNYAYEVVGNFVEMLSYRQSLEDFDKSMKLTYGSSFSAGNIEIWPVFLEGATKYRVIKLSAYGMPNEIMFVQIYDEKSFESQEIYVYQNEGGIEGEIVLCDFVHDLNKTYLIIIHKETGINSLNNYYLVNYEINGKEISNYNALKEEFSSDIWSVSEEVYFHNEVHRIGISSGHRENDSQWVFEDNTFTITFNIEAVGEISLFFKDGFWKVINTPATPASEILTYDEAMAICNAWLDSHPDLPSYSIYDLSHPPYEIPPPTFRLFGEEYYEFFVSRHWDETPWYGHKILVHAETGSLLSLFIEETDGERFIETVEKLDDWYYGEQDEYSPALLSADDAIAIYNAWKDSRFDTSDYCLNSQSYDKYVIFGEQYYYFHAEDYTAYWYNILVHMKTGELINLQRADGIFWNTDIRLLDDWYDRISSSR